MAIHKSFPTSPYEQLNPEYRWFPADETLRDSSYEKLLPPLVHKIRKEIKNWRDSNYDGASNTSKSFLTGGSIQNTLFQNLTELWLSSNITSHKGRLLRQLYTCMKWQKSKISMI